MTNDMIFGIRPILEALEAGKTIDKIFVQRGLKGPLYSELKSALDKYKISPNFVPVEKLNRLCRQNHQGVVAYVTEIVFQKIEELLPQLLAAGKTPLLIMLDKLTDVRNFGAIVRTAECVGADAIIIPEKGGAPVSADAIKTSAGAMFNIDICKEDNLSHVIDFLQESGVQVLVASEKAEQNHYQTDLTQPLALVFGNEEKGISKDVMHHADGAIKLPIVGKTQSLNVSVACGAILYEALRQRSLEA
jgi:23S rRNA (guanosine2251-2'-O)-methyltransferase